MNGRGEFDAAYDRYKTDIFRFIFHLTGNRTEAEDLFQEAWLRVVRHGPLRPAGQNRKAWLQRDIDQAIAGLPEKQRRVFLLSEFEGLRQMEIAGIMGIPVGTVKSLLYRAVKKLQRDLSAHNPKAERIKCDAKILSV